ncbi:hypothetical protein VTI74DRAFT_11437 [Chaetomium olivicolor]
MPLAPALRSSLRAPTAASMARPKIKLYVDTLSPFAYEAYYILRNEEVFKACDITYVPIFLGGLIRKCGNTPPIKIKNKDKWIGLERLRWAQHFSIPITQSLPPDFPAPTLPIMCAMCAIEASDKTNSSSNSQPNLTKALDTFFQKHWVDGVGTHKPEVLKETLVGLFGEAEAERSTFFFLSFFRFFPTTPQNLPMLLLALS